MRRAAISRAQVHRDRGHCCLIAKKKKKKKMLMRALSIAARFLQADSTNRILLPSSISLLFLSHIIDHIHPPLLPRAPRDLCRFQPNAGLQTRV